MKILPVGAEFCVDGRTDGQADITMLIIAFRNLRTRIKTERENEIKALKE